MSSRMKLLLTVFLLALVVSIAAYVYVMWEPANPLRFRVVAITPVPPSAAGGEPFELDFVIVNISSVPLRLHFADPAVAVDAFRHVEFGTEVAIPANSTVRLKRPIPQYLKQAIEAHGGINVRYTATSGIKRSATTAASWLRARLPEPLKAQFPVITLYLYETDLEHSHAPAASAHAPAPTPAP